LPERYGPWQTVANRFYRWEKKGLWEHLFQELLASADQNQQVDWDLHFMDGTIVRAHQHASGIKGGARNRRKKPWVTAGAASLRRSTSRRRVMAD
jgi:transposase